MLKITSKGRRFLEQLYQLNDMDIKLLDYIDAFDSVERLEDIGFTQAQTTKLQELGYLKEV